MDGEPENGGGNKGPLLGPRFIPFAYKYENASAAEQAWLKYPPCLTV